MDGGLCPLVRQRDEAGAAGRVLCSKVRQLYTPNTDRLALLGGNRLPGEPEGDILEESTGEERGSYIQGPDGKMRGSRPGSGKSGSGKKSRKGTGKSLKIGKKERVRLSHQILTDFPTLKEGPRQYPYENRNHFYLFSVNGPGEYSFHRKIRIEGNEEFIAAIRRELEQDGV